MAWVLALCLPVIAAASEPEGTAQAPAGESRRLDAATMAALGITESPTAEAARAGRPVAPESGTWSWTPGQYSYDGSGNITAIGTEASFLYDTRGRLVDATLTRAQATEQRGYVYDAFGNRTLMTGGSSSIATTTSTATNHLTGLSAVYDAAGNVTQIQPPGQSTLYQQKFDALGALQEVKAANVSGTPTVLHIYTADDERLWTFDLAANASHWKLRDLQGKVVRDYYVPGTNWTLSRDYIYRDGALLAAVTPTDTLHFSLDHLGTPRVITGTDRNRLGFHHYLPFGEEWTDQSGDQEGEVMKFTGHERDPDAVSGDVDGFDYMHARYYSATVGRFLSVDPVTDTKRSTREPQSWNRYAYVVNNPINRIDPDGRVDGAYTIDAARQLYPDDREAQRAFTQDVSNKTLAATLAFASLFIPDPSDLLIGTAAAALGRRLFARFATRAILSGAADACACPNVFRGGQSMMALAKDVKIVDGLVQPTRGVSLNAVAADVVKFGGAYRVTWVPDGLQIIQRGKTNHYELVATKAMTMAEYQKLLAQVKVVPAN